MKFMLIIGLWLMTATGVFAEAVPEFTATDLQGKQHSLKDYEGKMVVLNYWATWCPPCLEEIPVLAVFHEAHKDKDAVVLGVAFEDIKKEALAEFVENQFIGYPVLPVKPGPRTAFGRLIGLPTTYLIAPDRSHFIQHVGLLTPHQLERYLKQLSKPAQ